MVDHFTSVTGCVVHRCHPRTLFRGGVFQQGLEYLHTDIARQQLGQNDVFGRFKLVGTVVVFRGLSPGIRFGLDGERHQLLSGHDLGDRRLELGIDEGRRIKGTVVKHGQNVIGDGGSLVVGQGRLVEVGNLLDDQVTKFAPERLRAFFTDAVQLDLLASGLQLPNHPAGFFYQVGIETPTETPVSRTKDDHVCVALARACQQRQVGGRPRSQVAQHPLHTLSVGAGRLGLFLRTTQLRRRHHFHGGGDLPRVLHASDAIPQIL